MKKLLIVIDAQNSFVNKHTVPVLAKIDALVQSQNQSQKFDEVIFTKFINEENSPWRQKLHYDGCTTEDQQRIAIDTHGHRIFEKRTYSALTDEMRSYLQDNAVDEIYLCGFDTDACVQKTALDLFERGYDVYVLGDCCMSHAGPELHNTIINNLPRLIGRDKVK